MKWPPQTVSFGAIALLAGTATAQLNLLTPREAVQILERVPEVASARKQGLCPQFDAGYGDTLDRLGVQVRAGCGVGTGQWIGSYQVDLGDGAVFRLGSKERISDSEVAAFARTLVSQATARVLTSDEARCLALEAAKGLPGWNMPGHDVSIQWASPSAGQFRARLRSHDPPAVTERLLMVDRTTGQVHDIKTGLDVVTSGLAILRSKMLVLHSPPLLLESDALEIAREIPEVQVQARKPCSVYLVGGPLSWENILVEVQSHCEGTTEESHIAVAVDSRTGAVSDRESQRRLESAAADRTARERLEKLEREKAATREYVNSACRGN